MRLKALGIAATMVCALATPAFAQTTPTGTLTGKVTRSRRPGAARASP